MCFDRTTKIAVVFKKSEVAVIFIKERLFFGNDLFFGIQGPLMFALLFSPLFLAFGAMQAVPASPKWREIHPAFPPPLLGSRH